MFKIHSIQIYYNYNSIKGDKQFIKVWLLIDIDVKSFYWLSINKFSAMQAITVVIDFHMGIMYDVIIRKLKNFDGKT